MLRVALASFFVAAASAGTPDNVSSRLMIHVSQGDGGVCRLKCVTEPVKNERLCGVT
jgi:hypothetical protein